MVSAMLESILNGRNLAPLSEILIPLWTDNSSFTLKVVSPSFED
jgi:hypothetical protein